MPIISDLTRERPEWAEARTANWQGCANRNKDSTAELFVRRAYRIQGHAVAPRVDSQPGLRGAFRLLDTLLLAAVTTKPAVALAGFGVGLDRGGLVRSLTA
jgi:hypothetical protein